MNNALYLTRLMPDIRSRDARRDITDCMAMHRTLMSAFPDQLSPAGAARAESGVLYRMDADVAGRISLLVQSALAPDWTKLPAGWSARERPPQVKEIGTALYGLKSGQPLRFKLVANPTKKIDTKTGPDGKKNNGRRVELRGEQEWVAWLERKAEQAGFRLRAVRAATHVPDVRSGQELRATGVRKGPDGGKAKLTFAGVSFEGHMEVTDREVFLQALRAGIGPGKAYGFGLLSLAPGG